MAAVPAAAAGVVRYEVIDTRNAQPPILLSTFCNSVDVGDLLFFSGSNLKSRVLKLVSWCEWTHVGMVDVCATTGRRFLWESQSDVDNCVDVLTRSSKKTGPRLVELNERLSLYAANAGRSAPAQYGDGARLLDVCMKKFWLLPTPAARVAFAEKVQEFQQQVSGRTFERSKGAMIRAQYSEFVGQPVQDTTQYFCSELVVDTYKYAGAVPADTNVSQHTPSGMVRDCTRTLPFNSGFALGPQRYEYTLVIPPLSDALRQAIAQNPSSFWT
jgi:hypothetical protein